MCVRLGNTGPLYTLLSWVVWASWDRRTRGYVLGFDLCNQYNVKSVIVLRELREFLIVPWRVA